MKFLKSAVAGLLMLGAAQAAHAGATLDAVRKKGFVQCGVSTGVAGFSNPDSKGVWSGLDVDLCKAIAATVFGDAAKFKLTPLNTQQRFTALQSGEVDVLTRNTSITLQRDAALGLNGVGVNFYDGQGIMVPKKLGVKSARDLNGAAVCLQPGTTTELNLADWFRAAKITFKPVVIDKFDELVRAFAAGRCDAYTTDASALGMIRTTMLSNPDDYVILPEMLSKEPLGPMVRQGDEQWTDIVKWTLNATIEAEEYGITTANVDQMLKSANPNVQRILGVSPGSGKSLGVDEKWAYNIVKQVGNYGESFERSLGQGSPMKMARGSNALWTKGGLMYALPIRSDPMTRLSWNNPAARAAVYQAAVLAAIALLAWFLVSNTLANLASRNIASGFDFLGREAGFAIGESPIAYTPQDSYARAIAVGLLNTLRVAAIGIVLATVLGTLVGVARLSGNWLAARLAGGYVELIRNTPLLLQLFLWYALVTESTPGPRQALHPLPGVFISNRGIKLPALADHLAFDLALAGFALAVVLSLVLAHLARRRVHAGGESRPLARWFVALLAGLPIVGWLAGGAPLTLDVPQLQGFDFVGGITLTPEFAALLAGLVAYTSAFIAEVVRSGILAVDRGQWEAAGSLGLRRGAILRLVVLPQALRVIVPPLTNQYLNVVKNSSLAVAIGYPDLVSVANTTLNQTGQAIEGIVIIMSAYLVVSLSISVFMNIYNRRIALVER